MSTEVNTRIYPGRITRANILLVVRRCHLYLGFFAAPAILFFSFTGALQTFNLHKPSANGAYLPARWIVVLAQIHKNQTTEVRKDKTKLADKLASAKKAVSAKKAQTVKHSPQSHNPLPLKLFFLIVCFSLSISTFSGIYMSYRYNRNRLQLTFLLIAGAVIPLILLAV
jgi:uncharacterized iron-regulated membrane protein